MASTIHALTIDCHDHERIGRFWAAALGFGDDPADPNTTGDPAWLLVSPDRSVHLLFQHVDEAKQVKNRWHLDLRPTDRSREEECERLAELGASQVADHRRDDGSGWVVMADPEGNEFCVLRQAAQ